MILITEVNNKKELIESEERWNRFLLKTSFTAPYYCYNWYCSALKTIDNNKTPLLLFFSLFDQDIAYAPLVYEEKKIMGITFFYISFIQNAYTPYQGIVYLDSFEDVILSLIKYLDRKFHKRYVINLNEMRLNTTEKKIFNNLLNKKVIYINKEEGENSRYLKLNNTFHETLKLLKKKTQKEFKRKIKRISELGNINLKQIKGKKLVSEHLEKFFQLYALTWKGKEPFPEFYFNICKKFGESGQLYLFCLYVCNRPVAYLISILCGKKLYGIKTTYDPAFCAFSPGVILFYKCIEELFSIGGVEEFDIGRGNEQFKREWTNLYHEQIRMELFPCTLFWRLINQMRFYILPFFKKNKTFTKLYDCLRVRTLNSYTDNSSICTVKELSVLRKRFELYKLPTQILINDKISTKYAVKSDKYHLAVAMGSKNIDGISNRLENNKCVLMIKESWVVGYFWLSYSDDRDENGNHGPGININDWNIADYQNDKSLSEICINKLCKFLKENEPQNSYLVLY